MGEGVVKNSEKLPTSFMDDPLGQALPSEEVFNYGPWQTKTARRRGR